MERDCFYGKIQNMKVILKWDNLMVKVNLKILKEHMWVIFKIIKNMEKVYFNTKMVINMKVNGQKMNLKVKVN